MTIEQLAAPYSLPPEGDRWEASLGGLAIRLKARSVDTGGAFTLFEYDAPPGWAGPAWHVHRDLDEATYVVDGELRVKTGDRVHELEPGGFVWMPRDVPHGFANATSEPCRFVGVVSPPGEIEEMFQDIATYVRSLNDMSALDPARMDEINRKHGVEVLGPPILASGA